MPDSVRFFLIMFAWLFVAVALPFPRPIALMTIVTIVWAVQAYRRAYQRELERCRTA